MKETTIKSINDVEYDIIVDMNDNFTKYISDEISSSSIFTVNSEFMFKKQKNDLTKRIKSNLDKFCNYYFDFSEIKEMINISDCIIQLNGYNLYGFACLYYQPNNLHLVLICSNKHYKGAGSVLINAIKEMLKYI